MNSSDRDDVLELVRAGGLLVPGRPLLVMLSGGRDSICLLDVATRLLGPGLVRALHVNYGLRESADGDEGHCRQLCETLDVDLTVRHARPPRRGNLQAWARDARYGPAAELALRRDALVATGHTAGDQVEGILYRLSASPGRRALLGMPARNGRLVRPLLELTREQTAAHCRARGLHWREDESNSNPRYARARVRGALVPTLRSIHPAAERNVLETAQLLREEAEVLDELVQGVLAGRAALPRRTLGELAPALRRLVLRHLAEDAAGRAVPQAARRADELLALTAAPGSAELHLGGGLRAVSEYGVLRFAGTPPTPPAAEVLLPVPGSAAFGEWQVAAAAGPPERRDGVLDAAVLTAPLVVRAWRDGDRMAPLGLGATRALSDLFCDRRVPRERRRALPIVESGGEIAWVPGVATSERFRIGSGTSTAVHLSARPAS